MPGYTNRASGAVLRVTARKAPRKNLRGAGRVSDWQPHLPRSGGDQPALLPCGAPLTTLGDHTPGGLRAACMSTRGRLAAVAVDSMPTPATTWPAGDGHHPLTHDTGCGRVARLHQPARRARTRSRWRKKGGKGMRNSVASAVVLAVVAAILFAPCLVRLRGARRLANHGHGPTGG